MKQIIRRIVRKFVRIITFQKQKERYEFKQKCKKVRKYGPEALKLFSQITEKLNVEYSLMYGTLLGSYREHTFIKHDDDIDIAVRRSCITLELINAMKEKGFRYYYTFLTDDNTRVHVSFDFKGVKFDLYSFFVSEDGTKATSSIPRSLEEGWDESFKQNSIRVLNMTFPYKGVKIIDFEGAKVKVFSNPDEILRINYGDDFMTPIKQKKARRNDNVYFDDVNTRVFRVVSDENLKRRLC